MFGRGKGRRTVDELGEMRLGDWVATVETDLDVVAVPIGAEVSALVFDIDEGCSETDVASAGARSDLWCRRWCFGDGGRGRLGWLGENISRSEGIKEFSREREEMVLIVLGHC